MLTCLTFQKVVLVNEEYGFALKSHFDFIVCNIDSLRPLFALEFDGESHTTDIQKNGDYLIKLM